MQIRGLCPNSGFSPSSLVGLCVHVLGHISGARLIIHVGAEGSRNGNWMRAIRFFVGAHRRRGDT